MVEFGVFTGPELSKEMEAWGPQAVSLQEAVRRTVDREVVWSWADRGSLLRIAKATERIAYLLDPQRARDAWWEKYSQRAYEQFKRAWRKFLNAAVMRWGPMPERVKNHLRHYGAISYIWRDTFLPYRETQTPIDWDEFDAKLERGFNEFKWPKKISREGTKVQQAYVDWRAQR